jgi:non-specific serine/threonine protein kinase/serine/threonine-protein kinase
MNTVRWESVKELLHQALQLAPEERRAFVERSCGADAALQAELESLLSASDEVRSSFMQSPPVAEVGAGTLQPGDMVAQRFELLHKLGEGGMGQVWRAEQISPVRRPVALKLIKGGMYDGAVVQRFQAERQSLAIMDHPAIAKVFDAGATEQGQPYFVMEYVPGVSITEYCDQKKFDIRRRLELFRQVCEGVQHAHQKAIIHRDLKPANILVVEVDGKPVPRIIDFGLAKAAAARTGESVQTQIGGLVGTPGYMSPEQADGGADVDTRTDVYSLGVVLYVLLTGAAPIDTKDWQREPLEVLRRLREDEPMRPSAKVSSNRDTAVAVAAARDTQPATLASELRGDLDWIALKALEKDRGRRYGTPSELAADIQRYLNHEPVSARPASAGYRLQKYVQRHRAGVAAVSALVLLLAGVAGLQAVELRRITRERDRANRERDRATRVTDFMTNMFKMSDPSQARGNSVTVREVLDKASKDIDKDQALDPQLRAQLMSTMGSVYEKLGLYPQSQALVARAVELNRQTLGPDNADTLRSAALLAHDLEQLGRYGEAEKLERETIAAQTRVLGAEHPDTLQTRHYLGWTLRRQRREGEAEKVDRETLAIRSRVLGPENLDTVASKESLAQDLRAEQKYPEAEQLERETLETRKRVLGPEDPATVLAMSNLGIILQAEGRYAEADTLDRETLAARRKLLGPEHPQTLATMNNLVIVLRREGKFEEAVTLGNETLEIERRVMGPEHLLTLATMSNLAFALASNHQYADATQMDREILDIRRRVEGPENANTLGAMENLGADLELEHKYAEAEQLERQALATMQRVQGPEKQETLNTADNLARTLCREGRCAEAEQLAVGVRDTRLRLLGPENPDTAEATYVLASIRARSGKPDQAVVLLHEAVEHGLSPDRCLGIESDTDFKALQGDPRFNEIVAEAKQKAKEERPHS